ncbi:MULTISPECIES: hypothetical protein [unclassified Mycobacterium]|uniref:hypothetical protein n=1 Tax=unclassified Mycobacterium TaxID=2642494 RepID=UPI00068FB18D|nr:MULTISPECIES: hypothetical protein [unclassified Mycobacterium]SEB14924.1 hypothetical protein SAMN04488580_108140 [Mycobacterium sp. 283mftsu]
MRRDDALLTVAGLSVSVFLTMAGPSMAIAAADPGGSNGNGGNSSSGKAGSGKSSSPRGNAGNGNSGNGGSRGNSGANSSVSGQTNTGKSSKANGKSNNTAPGARPGSGSDNPAAMPVFTPPNPLVPVVVAEQHTGTSPGGTWWRAPGAPQPTIEVHEPSAPSEEGDADLLSADHSGIPVWAAAEPLGVRGDLFGLAGLVLMPLVGLVVGYRQAKAARDIGETIPR